MFTRLLKYSIKNILRNKFLSFSSVLVLTLLMFFINVLFVLHNVSIKIIDSINSKLTISLYLEDKYDKNSLEIMDLEKDIRELSKSIDWQFKSKDEVLEDLRQTDPDLVRILERTNPLPATITLSNVDIVEYELLNNVIENKSFILSKNELDTDHFSNYTTQYDKINSVITILNAGQIWLYFIIVIFFASILVITYSIIGNFIYYYKDEIYITRLVWWGTQFIYGPFVLQGMIYSIISFLVSFTLFLFISKNITYIFTNFYSFTISFNLFIIELIIFTLIWWISWYVSSKKYLK